jgi:hypothetical protein
MLQAALPSGTHEAQLRVYLPLLRDCHTISTFVARISQTAQDTGVIFLANR